MRALSESLLAAQKGLSISPAVRITLFHGVDEVVPGNESILSVRHSEGPYSHRAERPPANTSNCLDEVGCSRRCRIFALAQRSRSRLAESATKKVTRTSRGSPHWEAATVDVQVTFFQ